MCHSEYLKLVQRLDKLPQDEITPVLFGLYGEVGELMTIVKKEKREPGVFSAHPSIVTEELGDVFWYLCCLANRLELDMNSLLGSCRLSENTDRLFLLSEIGKLAGNFLDQPSLRESKRERISLFLKYFLALVKQFDSSIDSIIEANAKKISGRFLPCESYDDFDKDFPEHERLPESFEIEYMYKTDTRVALRWKGVFIGNTLSDNSHDADGYRFHDVFHFSYAAILHWSPTFRSLIKHKRGSVPDTDENEDGGRAIVVEEGLSAWIFNVAKENEFFEGRKHLSFDTLKHVQQVVKGLEVESCPLSLWEKAILEGYKVFRSVRKNNGGIVIGNRNEREIFYKERKPVG